ncbi:TonB-dependent receptor [Steroidobacter agaridevorans]|uniref:TonB-dependent receptor n=2 Tax=Steroidobacter agaridevorans TaxID=2695856 RepID=A0A829YB02_9GAMM|nr:TonB-dependent receptor [Steroidobacter agaridevorans]
MAKNQARRTHRQRMICAAAVSATTVLSSGFAHAQAVASSTEPQVGQSLEEVMVTARRREESAQSVPIAVTALGAAELENHRVESLENLQTVVPALSVSAASGRPNAPVYSLRGIRPTEALYGQDPTVAVYFADVVISPAEGTNLGMYDLASLQVLKGPQGTLFGRNTTGGAVLLTPKRPGREFGGDVKIGFGNYGRNETQLGLDMPFADSFAMRLSGRTIDSDGYQTNVAPGPMNGAKLGGESTRSARVSAVWDVTDNVENYTIVSWDSKDTNGRGTVLQAINPATTLRCYDGPTNPNGPCGANEALPSYFDALERARGRDRNDVESDMRQRDETEVWGIVNTTTVSLSDTLTLKSIAGYRDFETYSEYDIDASAIPGILTSMQTATLQHASYELQLLGSAFDNRFDWVTGLYWYNEDGVQNSPGDVLVGVNPNNPFMQLGAVDNSSYSFFAQGIYRLTPELSLTAGVRWNYDEKEMTLSSKTPAACSLRDPNTGALLPADRCSVTLSDSFSQPTGTLSLDYKVRDDVLLYAASRLGYRSGGFNLRATTPVEYAPFDPETVIDLELGIKADWFVGDWRMRSNVAAYNQWYDDIQRTVGVTNPIGVPGSAIQNAAKANVFGIEVEQTIAPTDNLSLQLNYAYTKPEYDDWVDPFTGDDLTDTPFHFTPEHAAAASLTYTVPMQGAGELRFSASASYRSHVWINSLQTIQAIRRTPASVLPFMQQDAYTLLDLSAGWTGVMGSSFDISAYVKNVADKEYSLGGIQLYESARPDIRPFGIVTKAYGEPRTYGVELRYNF